MTGLAWPCSFLHGLAGSCAGPAWGLDKFTGPYFCCARSRAGKPPPRKKKIFVLGSKMHFVSTPRHQVLELTLELHFPMTFAFDLGVTLVFDVVRPCRNLAVHVLLNHCSARVTLGKPWGDLLVCSRVVQSETKRQKIWGKKSGFSCASDSDPRRSPPPERTRESCCAGVQDSKKQGFFRRFPLWILRFFGFFGILRCVCLP